MKLRKLLDYSEPLGDFMEPPPSVIRCGAYIGTAWIFVKSLIKQRVSEPGDVRLCSEIPSH